MRKSTGRNDGYVGKLPDEGQGSRYIRWRKCGQHFKHPIPTVNGMGPIECLEANMNKSITKEELDARGLQKMTSHIDHGDVSRAWGR